MAINQKKTNNNDIIIVFFTFIVLYFVLFSVMWYTCSPILGVIYKLIRTIESLGIWAIIPHGWGHYYWTTPAHHGFPFTSIFITSLPFNFIFALTIAAIGLLAYFKVKNQHIDSHIKNDRPIDYKELMRIQSSINPANEFFLLFPLEKYPLKKGPARLPLTAIEFLTDCDALVGIYDTLDEDPRAKTGWIINEAAVTRQLTSVFGPENPFTNSSFKWSSHSKLQEAIDAIPWHLVSLVYVCLMRLYALEVYVDDDDAFFNAATTGDQHLKNIWHDLNELKRKYGDTLTLGFIDADDEELQRTILKEKNDKALLKTFPEVLNEYKQTTVDGKTINRTTGESLKTSILARESLLRLLTCTTGAFDKPEWQKQDPGLSDQARLKIIRKRQKEFLNNTAYKLLTRNGYLFGMMSTLLTKTRTCGVLQPALFRWMRFYDYHMWSFLRVVGMNTPTVEVAGMFDHTQVEEKAGTPFKRPYLTTSVEGIRLEANKYITEDMRKAFIAARTRQAVASKTSEAAKIMASSITKYLRNNDLSGFEDEDIIEELSEWQNNVAWNANANEDQE